MSRLQQPETRAWPILIPALRLREAILGALHQKLNKVDREVGELRAAMALNHPQLRRVDAKLERVIERENP